MNISKTTVRLTVLLNLAALCCLICFAAIYLRHDTTVPNPDAMLPAPIQISHL